MTTSVTDAESRIVNLLLDGAPTTAMQPLTIGLPFPRGRLNGSEHFAFRNSNGVLIPCQSDVLARWSDGSVRWILFDSIIGPFSQQNGEIELVQIPLPIVDPSLQIRTENDYFVIDTGSVEFRVGRSNRVPWLSAMISANTVFDAKTCGIVFTDSKGRELSPTINQVAIEQAGPVRSTICTTGSFSTRPKIRFVLRTCFFAATGLIRQRLTIHNPQRAQHRGGLWDLGDPGSVFFRDLSFRLTMSDTAGSKTRWNEVVGGPTYLTADGTFEIYQDSSGGENWRSRNHIDRHGRVPCSFQGYRIRKGDGERAGLRASPVVNLHNSSASLTAAIPYFWQQFPKAIEAKKGQLTLRLFPAQFNDLFELQGGEQKTHTCWFHVGQRADTTVLGWVHQPIDVCAPVDWYADSGSFPDLAKPDHDGQLASYLNSTIEGGDSLFARREVIDEYGWRNFGDWYADHENAYANSQKPIISHYNNQFDCVHGCILQYVRSGDRRWRELWEPLARHVIDIDIYHTNQDRAAYRGGLFWMTDHYKDAASSTHRTYSSANRDPGKSYGGGPSSSHNFTTGLLEYYYLTGDPLAREAVQSLADWTIRMDDGQLTIWGMVDAGRTGLASRTLDPDYHGPGRGPGFSVTALLDAWTLTGLDKYVAKTEELIRRCIHPADDIAERDLLNAELRWSYPVFLIALADYLRRKTQVNQFDFMFAYGKAALLHYARWMADHERPYLECRDQLEYPTETWAAQEFRKANALRLAAEHADEPLRSRLISKATRLTDRAWTDLRSFRSQHSTRAIAIMLSEGTRDEYFRNHEPVQLTAFPTKTIGFGHPEVFTTQKRRIMAKFKSPGGLLQCLANVTIGLFKPQTWKILMSRAT